MGNIKDLPIKIIDAGYSWYKLAPQSKILGRMYDDKATNLVFTRPTSEVASSLRINFLVGTTEMGSIDIGTADEYEIPSVLTQTDSLTIGITFVATDYVKNSEMKIFELLEAAEPQNFVPTPIDDQWLELFEGAIVSATVEEVEGIQTIILVQNDGTEISLPITPADVVLSVNGETPDVNGNVVLALTDLDSQVTKTLYVDVNRTDSYTQNGSKEKPFKTLAQAVAIATNGMIIEIMSGTYAEDVSLAGGVSLINNTNVSATISGDVTFGASGVPISIKGCIFTGTNKTLTLNGTAHIFESYSYNKVVCGAGANIETHIFNVNCQESGANAITFNGTGYLNLHSADITAIGNASAINQTAGFVVLDGCKLYNSEATKATLLSTGGTVNADFTSAVNTTGGNAINLSANGATTTNPNALLNIIAVGDVVGKDTNTTIVSNIKFITTGSLVGTGLIFQPATQIEYDSSTTVKTKIDGKQPINLLFSDTDVLTTDFVSDATYADYDYRASVTLTGVVATDIPQVIFGVTEADSGNYASVATSYAGGVYIYAKTVPVATITIPTILIVRGA